MKEIKHKNKWKGSFVYELVELILLKYPYYAKMFIDSMQS